MQVRHDLACSGKCEPAIELQSVGARRNARLLSVQQQGTSNAQRSTSNVEFSTTLHAVARFFYIRSGTLIPRRSKPCCKTRAVRSHSTSRELRAGSSDFKTGHAS